MIIVAVWVSSKMNAAVVKELVLMKLMVLKMPVNIVKELVW